MVGPDHAKSFRVVAVISDAEYGTGWGRNKKEAEQRAAKETLTMLKAQLAERERPAPPSDAAQGQDDPQT